MHSGTITSLAAVLDFYDAGRGRTANPHVAANQRDAQFSTRVANKQAIVTFLNSLTAIKLRPYCAHHCAQRPARGR